MEPTPTFQSVCVSLGGEYRESYTMGPHYVSPACLWNGIDNPSFWDAYSALWSYCPLGMDTDWTLVGDPDWWDCKTD